MQSIYDNFGYGIDRHFYSIKQMSKFLHDNWKELEYVFIIGKGLEYNLIRRPNEVQDKLNKKYFVPTFGYLGSDNMLFSEDNFPDPYFAIGRLAARNADDIKNYLDKIIQNDNISTLPQTIKD
ncbi:MAG TPA: C25 family cysteine peptidase, partial [Saprospiraceae bacterium]|nr:C25 family cysteine peptidase [Saprospiraceae bacterium]